ncbi:MAG: TetR/AcrR family transcriptional regulator, partial [Lachnospiraceae bacterium]|nr:TetR/AcrR family transcriptional regulator [Lachnospiraceae bacterium]
MKKKTKRETQSEKKKKKIVEVSLKLFGAYGYNGTTIYDISKASGFSTGSIYNFFGNKA